MSQVEKKESLFDKIAVRVSELTDNGGLDLPKNYSVDNALKSAYLILQDTVDRDKKPVLNVCTQASITNSILKMVSQGMNPAKTQCYFIAYGDKLTYMRSYHGSIALAKRVGDVKEVNANIIYQDDNYVTEIDTETGRRRLIKHDSPFTNRDDKKILGGYAIVLFNDGTSRLEEMTIAEIRQAWMMGQTKGNSPAHNGFSGEMAKRTIINRALKVVINSSSDSDLMDEDQPNTPDEAAGIKEEVKAKANRKALSFDDGIEDAQVVTETKKQPEPEKVKKAEQVKPIDAAMDVEFE
jgi:recombination protein RecT